MWFAGVSVGGRGSLTARTLPGLVPMPRPPPLWIMFLNRSILDLRVNRYVAEQKLCEDDAGIAGQAVVVKSS